MKVSVYYNLHKKKYSIVSRETNNRGRVIFHTQEILLKNITFVVREKGRQKVIQTKTKNVHAFVNGEVIEDISIKKHLIEFGHKFTYNPYLMGNFYSDENKLLKADFVLLGEDKKLYL